MGVLRMGTKMNRTWKLIELDRLKATKKWTLQEQQELNSCIKEIIGEK